MSSRSRQDRICQFILLDECQPKIANKMKISNSTRSQKRVLLFVLFSIAQVTLAERVSDKIYTTLQSDHYCSRRLNATHQVGCQSELGGNEGVVWIIEDASDLVHVLQKGPTPPYVAILRKNFYTRKNILDFKTHPGRVSGVVFLDKDHDDSKSRSSPFSPEDTCPNRYSGLYVNDSQWGDCKHHWLEESPVAGLLYDDIPFPIFLINEQISIEHIESCYKENNVIAGANSNPKTQADYPLCGIQLDSFMLAAKDSYFCLNSHYLIDELLQSNTRRCDSVDNNNIFAYYNTAQGPLHTINGSTALAPDIIAPKSVVMLVAKLSSLSMFSGISPGADSTITSIVTLLAVAEALGRVRNATEVTNSKRNIAFAILDSEPFDYTGSSRMVYNMVDNSFPYNSYLPTNESIAMQNINLNSVDYLINLDQMGNYPGSDSIYFHSQPNQSTNDKEEKIYKIMARIAKHDQVKLERETSLPLPPTSVQEFIKGSQTLKDNQLTGIVLSNYGQTYKNQLYHSIYDDSHNIYQTSRAKQVQHLTKVAQLVARSLYEVTYQENSSADIAVKSELIDQLLECYLIDAQCHLFTRAFRAGQRLPAGAIPTYKDPTKRSDDMNGMITESLLAYFIGEKIPDTNYTTCAHLNQVSTVYDYRYINDNDKPVEDSVSGACIKSQVLLRSSGSPAYSIVNDEIVLDTRYPAWTISYNRIRNPVRLYLKSSPASQWSLFVLGLLVTLTSFVIVLALRTRIECVSSLNDEEVATSA